MPDTIIAEGSPEAAEPKSSLQIMLEMKSMAEDYNTAIRKEWLDLAIALTHHFSEHAEDEEAFSDHIWDELSQHVTRDIRSNRSRSSGGHCVVNVCEQLRLDTATELLDRQSPISQKISNLIEAAHKAAVAPKVTHG